MSTIHSPSSLHQAKRATLALCLIYITEIARHTSLPCCYWELVQLQPVGKVEVAYGFFYFFFYILDILSSFACFSLTDILGIQKINGGEFQYILLTVIKLKRKILGKSMSHIELC